MIENINSYIEEKRIYIDDLIAELDMAKSSEEIMTVALKIKGRRSAAEAMFHDLYKIIHANE